MTYLLRLSFALWGCCTFFAPAAAQPGQPKPLARLVGEWNVFEQEGMRGRLSEKSEWKITFSAIDNGNGLLVTIIRKEKDHILTRQGCWFHYLGSGQVFGQNSAQHLEGALDPDGNLRMKVYPIGEETADQDFSFIWLSDDAIRWEGKYHGLSGREAEYVRVLRREY